MDSSLSVLLIVNMITQFEGGRVGNANSYILSLHLEGSSNLKDVVCIRFML